MEGKEIPLAGRLMAIADVYDALVSRRVYKEPMPHKNAINIIRIDSGSHFDPEIVKAFMTVQDKIKEIADRYSE